MENLYSLTELTSTPRIKGVLPVSPATWWRWIKVGDAPAPIRLGGNRVAWKQSDIEAWVSARESVPYEPNIRGPLRSEEEV